MLNSYINGKISSASSSPKFTKGKTTTSIFFYDSIFFVVKKETTSQGIEDGLNFRQRDLRVILRICIKNIN